LPRHYVYEDGRPGRPKATVHRSPPKDFRRLIDQMARLDDRGWYRELAKRQRREFLLANPRPDKGRRIADPEEMDRIMGRTEVVALCNTPNDLEIARFNKRLVLEIDPACPQEILFEKIAALLKRTQNEKARRINTKAWAEHRIIALYDLKLEGYDLSKERKQLSEWLFPEINDDKRRGDKFDRAVKYLKAALSSLNTIRAQAT
jgi:hypothetical protein